MTEEQQRQQKTLLEKNELDLGFCKITVKPIKGGRGKSHGTEFKIGKFYKLGIQMSKELRDILNKELSTE